MIAGYVVLVLLISGLIGYIVLWVCCTCDDGMLNQEGGAVAIYKP